LSPRVFTSARDERFKGKPLVYPIAYKSVAFTVLLIVTYIVEEIVMAMFHGKSFAEAMPDIGGGTLWGLIAVSTIMSFALIPFFAFKEFGRALGEDKPHVLIFGLRSEMKSPALSKRSLKTRSPSMTRHSSSSSCSWDS
jgi:hypothetical protein